MYAELPRRSTQRDEERGLNLRVRKKRIASTGCNVRSVQINVARSRHSRREVGALNYSVPETGERVNEFTDLRVLSAGQEHQFNTRSDTFTLR